MYRDEIAANMTRRDMLKVFGAAAVAAGTAQGAETGRSPQSRPDLRSKAKKNLKLGIFTSVYGHLTVEEAARKIKEDGFAGVVCDFLFKDIRFDPATPDWEAVRKIRATLERQGIEVAGQFGYYNVVDPHEDKRKWGEARMDLLLREWKRFGSPIVSTETGTFNKESQWKESPENDTEAGYVACREAMKKLAGKAEKAGAVVAIEGYWRNIIGSAERAERLFKEVDSPGLRLTMDPCNYFRNEDLPRMKPILNDLFKRVGRQTVLAHAKDVKAGPNGSETPAAGRGEMDYPLYLRLLAELDKELWLVVEHLQIDDVARARDYVKAQFDRL
ncbi:MAG TPA: sugar phosphate isomerase/epimerase [Phycisphaerae bacterium]|nr:sugar phosphate isomerase/epimerase [Phycisphaerae bacterium]